MHVNHGLTSAGRDELVCKVIELSYEDEKVLIQKGSSKLYINSAL